jgi:hypothetical protein
MFCLEEKPLADVWWFFNLIPRLPGAHIVTATIEDLFWLGFFFFFLSTYALFCLLKYYPVSKYLSSAYATYLKRNGRSSIHNICVEL